MVAGAIRIGLQIEYGDRAASYCKFMSKIDQDSRRISARKSEDFWILGFWKQLSLYLSRKFLWVSNIALRKTLRAYNNMNLYSSIPIFLLVFIAASNFPIAKDF